MAMKAFESQALPLCILSSWCHVGLSRLHSIYSFVCTQAYVFPALGHAAILASASHLPDEVFLMAARVLSEVVSDDELAHGSLFPSFDRILWVSKTMMVKVCVLHTDLIECAINMCLPITVSRVEIFVCMKVFCAI